MGRLVAELLSLGICVFAAVLIVWTLATGYPAWATHGWGLAYLIAGAVGCVILIPVHIADLFCWQFWRDG